VGGITKCQRLYTDLITTLQDKKMNENTKKHKLQMKAIFKSMEAIVPPATFEQQFVLPYRELVKKLKVKQQEEQNERRLTIARKISQASDVSQKRRQSSGKSSGKKNPEKSFSARRLPYVKQYSLVAEMKADLRLRR
jgi:hypothetical protein